MTLGNWKKSCMQLHCQAPNCTKEQMMQFENFGEAIAHKCILHSISIIPQYTVGIS